MEIVLTKESIVKCFDSLDPSSVSEIDNALRRSIFNTTSVIKLSRELLMILEHHLKSIGGEYADFLGKFIISMSDNNRVNVVNIHPEKNTEEFVLKETLNAKNERNHKEHCFLIKYGENYPNLDEDPRVCQIDRVNRPNKHWVLLALMSGETTEVNYSHFTNSTEIKDFIQTLVLVTPEAEKNTYILDSYFNTTPNNHVLSSVKVPGRRYKCFTRKFQDEDQQVKRDNIKNFFGRNQTAVKFSTDLKIVHERTVLIGDLCLNANHDFKEVQAHNQNWSMYIKLCKEKRALIENKLLKYH